MRQVDCLRILLKKVGWIVMQMYEKCKKFVTWFMSGITVLLMVAMMMQIDICGYAAATIFWDVFIPLDIALLVIALVIEKLVKK